CPGGDQEPPACVGSRAVLPLREVGVLALHPSATGQPPSSCPLGAPPRLRGGRSQGTSHPEGRTMSAKISLDVLDSHLQCKTKAHLKLTGERGQQSDYEALLRERRAQVRSRAVEKMLAGRAEGEVPRDLLLTPEVL